MDNIDFGARSGFRVPRVNIGGMRLPRDEDEAIELIRYAIDRGMRYIDTSRGYMESEVTFGKALKDGYREKVILSTKWSPWVKKIEPDDDASASCTRKRIEESMRRLDVDYLDFYQVWNIHSPDLFEQAVAKGGMVEAMLRAKDEGLIGHTGFTCHDSVDNAIAQMERADWCEIILFTYNLGNRDYARALRAARERGIGTVVMNPVGGGRLAEDSPVLDRFRALAGCRSNADLALRYCLANRDIDTAIVGINKKSDVDDAVMAAEMPVFPAGLVAEVDAGLSELDSDRSSFCTGCRYCMPCPAEVNISGVMGCVSEARHWGLIDSARRRYERLKGNKADACLKCGECEPKCTQKLGIVEIMEWADENLG